MKEKKIGEITLGKKARICWGKCPLIALFKHLSQKSPYDSKMCSYNDRNYFIRYFHLNMLHANRELLG